MFGISLPELLVIMALVLIVFGPEKLPDIARKLGKTMADLRRSSDSVRREFYNSVYAPVDDVKRRTRAELRAIGSLDEPAQPVRGGEGGTPAADPSRKPEGPE